MARREINSGWVAIVAAMVSLFLLVACGMDQSRKREEGNMHVNIGTAYIESGDHNGALKELLTAEKLMPDEPRVHYFLAMAYHAKGYEEKAVDECKRAITLKPDYSEAHNLLGTIYMHGGKYNQAIASFQSALKNMIYDRPANALYNMGRAYYHLGDYAKAMSSYQEAMVRDSRGELVPLIEHGMGKTMYSQGDFLRAAARFKKSTELAPSYVESYFWLGESYMKTGKAKEAKKAFATVIKLAPDSDFSSKAQESLDKLNR